MSKIYPWQNSTWQQLIEPLQQGRLSHALLITGEQGLGKSQLAKHFAKTALCLKAGQTACGECKSCLLFQAETHTDFQWIEPDGRQIKIDQIRAMIEQLSQTAQQGGRKVAVIAPAEAMNTAAANALLKCLEEPSGNTLIILLSHSPQRLLPTILSRCQKVSVHKPTFEQASIWLATWISDQAQREQLLRLANGNPLQAKEYFEQDLLSVLKQMQQLLRQMMIGQADIVADAQALMKNAGKTNQEKLEFLQRLLLINQWLIWQLIQQNFQLPNALTENSDWQNYHQQPKFAQNLYQLLELSQSNLKMVAGNSNPNPQLLLEHLLSQWLQILRS